jgi:glycosyltransferase involved in cell wall biosynthesis
MKISTENNKRPKSLFYFGLEPLKERYTYQLSKQWMPETFKKYESIKFIDVEGDYEKTEGIKVGYVLDAVGRGKYAMAQCSNFLEMLQKGEVSDGDIIFLQDFFTPGMDSIFYALDLYGIKIKLYSMLHAQSVDEYDFTYGMKNWMRHYELGLDSRHTGIFVGSTIHKEQLKQAGFKAPIHVISLPIHKELAKEVLPNYKSLKKQNKVIFTSRLDKEKNPYFMLKVAKEFLENNKDYTWVITTSGNKIKSSIEGLVDDLYNYSIEEPRFIIKENLTKEQYYQELAESKVLFNSSLQDYVSWTIIEATLFGCDVCFPNFRSFPDFLTEQDMYKPFYVRDAVNLLTKKILSNNIDKKYISDISDLGRQIEGYIVANGIEHEINIWHESEYCKKLLGI